MKTVSDLYRLPDVGGDQQTPVGAFLFAWGSPFLSLPFDILRCAYALGVQGGVIPRSLLASHKFDLSLARAEQMTLGPFARRL
jgi:hypothetical protein